MKVAAIVSAALSTAESLALVLGARVVGADVGAELDEAPDVGAPDVGAPDVGAPDVGASVGTVQTGNPLSLCCGYTCTRGSIAEAVGLP
jgi:hypothetical protein